MLGTLSRRVNNLRWANVTVWRNYVGEQAYGGHIGKASFPASVGSYPNNTVSCQVRISKEAFIKYVQAWKREENMPI